MWFIDKLKKYGQTEYNFYNHTSPVISMIIITPGRICDTNWWMVVTIKIWKLELPELCKTVPSEESLE